MYWANRWLKRLGALAFELCWIPSCHELTTRLGALEQRGNVKAQDPRPNQEVMLTKRKSKNNSLGLFASTFPCPLLVRNERRTGKLGRISAGGTTK